MASAILVTILFLCFIGHLYGEKRVNIEVTLHRDDVYSLFSEEEIWGLQFKNRTENIMKVNVVIDESKSILISTLSNILSFDMIYPDALAAIHEQREEINKTKRWLSCDSSLPAATFFIQYRQWDEYQAFLECLTSERFPGITSQSFMSTQTIQGRDIPIITLSTGGGGNKPGFYIQAVLHAREWLANAATMYILNALAEGYGNDDRITNILDNMNIYIAPTVNIDGYIYSWIDSSTRFWRKNRRSNAGSSTFGVDLNRNYDAPDNSFCLVGASSNPSSDTYCGTSPFSEPETQSSRDFMNNPTYNIRATFDMHTHGDLILWPWGYTRTDLPPPEFSEYQALGDSLSDAVFAIHNRRYESMTASDLYPCSGIMSDYSWYNSNGERYGFTFEGRGPGFNPSAVNIIPAGQEQLAAVLTMAEYILNNDK